MTLDRERFDAVSASSLWRAIIDIMPHMISIKDIDTRRYLFCNPECDKVLGSNAVGKTNFELLETSVAERIEREETALISNGGVAIVEVEVTDQDGATWTTRTKKFVVSAASGERYLVTVSEDVSEQHEHARKLGQAIAAAEAANAAKSAFLATMSHEIRTPLNGVLGMAQAMAASSLPAEQKRRLDIIRQSGETLLAILNDILDISKIEAGALKIETLEFELSALISSISAPFSTLAAQKGIELLFSIDDDAEGFYIGDPVRVRQILYNLVSNAIKFTNKGEVRIDICRGLDALTFTVSDTGLGIPKDRREAIFEKFTQAEASTTRRFGGTGLGLAICRELCACMKGSIAVTSEEGVGSAFVVTLPLPWLGRTTVAVPLDARQGQAISDIAPWDGLRVLAAEDNAVNQIVLKALLNQVGVDPVIVGDGEAVVEAWAREAWDIILMDVQMPMMNGIEATKAIRAREASSGRARIPIIALSADTMGHQVEAFSIAGMDDHVPKPIDAGQLFAVISRSLS